MATHPRTSEEEVLKAFHGYYLMWARREHQDDVEKLLMHCDPAVTCIGTGSHEILVGIEAYRQLILNDLAEAPGILDLDIIWSRAKVFEQTGIAEAEMTLKVPVDGAFLDIGLFRLSHVYRKKEGRWVIEHIHMSFPSSGQTDEEVWPMEALKARNLELERQVAQRTAELEQSLTQLKATQQQLIQQEKMASLGQLTAGIAHEIKNPLNFINNFAEVNIEITDELKEALAAGEPVEEIIADLKQNAQVINQHGKRADAIVHAMMQHASGGTGQREKTDINQLVREHIDLAYHGKRAQVSDLNVEIKRDLDGDAGTVEIVPQEIGRVLLNLLGNAFDAVHEHASKVNSAYLPMVSVSTRQINEKVEIRVSDNGQGIAKEIREKIFEPFFTTKPTGSGTGLGLSLSYDIVTQGHGGTLQVESEEGKGAMFIVTLPVNQTEANSSA